VDVIVTVCALENVPAGGLNVGAAAGPLIVYAPLVTLLSVKPLLYAIAFNAQVAAILTGAEYIVPTVELGVLPSVV
jgi:hypothetical protein